MNKQQLLNYFQTHYLSRQEVLFKLPLNISIDTFWPELLNWRKGHATMLPLYTTSGKPCWLVTTDKMVRASEILSEEALQADGSFDPYRVQMTPAMSQEAYFTSFVEGAEYPLEEAVAFLRRGTDPENMYEQNILNNHQAWSYMLGTLNVPFGERFVKDLAFYLTEGQNDGSIDYRQEDSADIPAMEGENYEVPPAFSIPERMEQFYQFLADTNIHPLIKAAIAQAWVFAVRPFPEANERLARMISSAVLLRCGYDFFLDISISANIAHESYRYFKAIKETIRSENDGDMTYFAEYYIQLLARALVAHRESRQQEALEAERQMAMQPLAPSPPRADVINAEMDSATEEPKAENATPNEKCEAAEYDDIEALIRGAVPINELEPIPPEMPPVIPSPSQPDASARAAESQAGSTQADKEASVQAPQNMAKYAALLADIEHLAPIDNFVQKMRTILEMDMFRFTSMEWSEIHLVDNEQAIKECDILYSMQVADRYMRHGRYFYLLRFDSPAELEELIRYHGVHAPVESLHSDANFWLQIASLEASRSDALRRAAVEIRSMLDDGILEFTKNDWIERTGMSEQEYSVCRCAMTDRNIVVNCRNPERKHTHRPGLFRFTIANDKTTVPDMKAIPEEGAKDETDAAGINWFSMPCAMTPGHALAVLSQTEETPRGQRLYDFLASDDTESNRLFTADEWAQHFQISRTAAEKDVRKGMNLGLLERSPAPDHKGASSYRLVSGTIDALRLNGLGDAKKALLYEIFQKFGQGPFSQEDFATLANLKLNSIGYRLDEFIDRGLFQYGKDGRKPYYRLTVSPDNHPECFQTQQAELMMAGVG